MAITILNKTKTRMRVKELVLPASESPLLGVGIDAANLPEGHLSCTKCKGYKFECWLAGDSHRVELGCPECNSSYRLLFPLDVIMPERQGRFTCHKHPTRYMVCIHNADTVCIGCESCYTEIQFKLKKASGLIVPN